MARGSIETAADGAPSRYATFRCWSTTAVAAGPPACVLVTHICLWHVAGKWTTRVPLHTLGIVGDMAIAQRWLGLVLNFF